MASKRSTVQMRHQHQAVTIALDTPLVQCAQSMHDANVSSLVVTGWRDGRCVAVGLLTDRAITIEVVAFDFDPHVITAGDIMAPLHLPVRVAQVAQVRERVESRL